MNYIDIGACKIIATVVASCLMATMWIGCKKETETLDSTLMVANDVIEVPGSSSERFVEFLSNSAWQLSTDVDWIAFEEEEGKKGKHKIKFEVEANDDDERLGTIQIAVQSGMEREIQIYQQAGAIQVFYVKTDGQGEGRSWEDATTLQNALGTATSGSTIHIAEGTYRPTRTITNGDQADDGDRTFEIRANIALIGGYPDDAKEETTADPNRYETILSGKQENNSESYHVVAVTAPIEQGQKVAINGVTIRDGHGSDRGTNISIGGNAYSRGYGAGMIIGRAVADLDRVSVINNRTSNEKGTVGMAAGVFVFAGADVTIKNSKINSNSSANNGGGLWVDRAKTFVYDSEINGNGGGTAAGVHAYPDAILYMYNSEVAQNEGRSYGAGVYLRENSKAVLVNCLISDNESTSANGGGGVMLYDNSEIDIISSTIVNNNIVGPGGGVYRRSGNNKINIVNSIIAGNKQVSGSSDVDVYEDSAGAPRVNASAIGNSIYDEAGSEVSNASFSFSSMVSASYRLQGADNPALEYGMNAGSLFGLVDQYDPSLDGEVVMVDFEGESREGSTIMGAYTK